MSEKKSGAKTLLWSIIMSAPGPLTVGLGLISGKSSTQLVDFVRRTAEFVAIVMSFVVFRVTNKDGVCDEEKKVKLERRSNIFVGSMMCFAGLAMAVLALIVNHDDKGNVVPGLVIAVLGMVANSLFWIKYTRLNKASPNSIISVQARLYRAKTLVDTSVTVALTFILFSPASELSFWIDLVGSVIVALYLAWCGLRTVLEALNKRNIVPAQD